MIVMYGNRRSHIHKLCSESIVKGEVIKRIKKLQ